MNDFIGHKVPVGGRVDDLRVNIDLAKPTESHPNTLEVTGKNPYTMERNVFEHLQSALATEVRERRPDIDDLCAVWFHPDDPYADLVRRLEHAFFPGDIPRVITPLAERQSRFMILLDLREGTDLIAFGSRVCSPGFHHETEIPPDSTGFPAVDERIREGRLTRQEFLDFCSEQDFDVSRCVSVETAFATAGWYPGPPERAARLPDRHGVPSAWIGFAHIYRSALRNEKKPERLGFFGLFNKASSISLRRIGSALVPMPGNTSGPGSDFNLSAIHYESTTFDRYTAVNESHPLQEFNLHDTIDPIPPHLTQNNPERIRGAR
jgi:hypothetical protein